MSSKLTQEQSALFMEIVERSVLVKHPDQFFQWLQGCFQYLIPHDVLICGLSYGEERYRYKVFSCLPEFQARAPEVLIEGKEGSLARAFRSWCDSSRPIALGGNLERGDHGSFSVPFSYVESALEDTLPIDNMVLHGVRPVDASVSTFFCFARMPKDPDANLVYILDLLMPYLHTLALQVYSYKYSSEMFAAKRKQSVQLTARESMVLKWLKKAKTNWEIAAILNISPLTVKNHVQNIMRKLEVDNRAQAVLKANQLNLAD